VAGGQLSVVRIGGLTAAFCFWGGGIEMVTWSGVGMTFLGAFLAEKHVLERVVSVPVEIGVRH